MMGDDKRHIVNRRKFLKAGAIPAAALVAGCSGGGGGSNSGDGSSGGSSGGDGSSGGGTTSSGGGGGSTSTPSLEERAKSDGTLNVVGALSSTEKFWKAFQDEYGVKYSFQFKDNNDTATKLISENKANKVTVDLTGDGQMGSPDVQRTLVKQGVLGKLPEGSIPDNPKNSYKTFMNGAIVMVCATKSLGILYNKEMVDSPPKTMDDLFSGDWDGKIYVDPRDSELIPAAKQSLGSDSAAKDFVQKLGKIASWHKGHLGAAKSVASGEQAMSVTYVKYKNYDWGGPLAEVDIKDFPTTGGGTELMVPDGAPHPDAAALAIQYSVNNMLGYLQDQFGSTVFLPADKMDEYFVITPDTVANYDFDQIDKNWQDWTGLSQ